MEVAQKSDVVFLIVGFPEDVQATVLGPKGVLAVRLAVPSEEHIAQPALQRFMHGAARATLRCPLDRAWRPGEWWST